MMRMLITGGSGFIGTNLVDTLMERGVELMNLDINPPKKKSHTLCWEKCDILDSEQTLRNFEKFQPTHVIHLAARTDTLSTQLEDYVANTDGTTNVLNSIKDTPAIQRVVITSSQFVFGPPGSPQNEKDYNPIGAYGVSKVFSEKATRTAGLNCVWTIIRPTNIWGPWHPRYPNEFWLMLKKGWYFHPGGKSAVRSYGYVKNIIYQMLKIFEAPPALVHEKVYYVGDPPIPLIEWVNGFALPMTGKPARTVPRWILQTVAASGTVLNRIGIRFPITLSRYHSMTEDYISPVDKTIGYFGVPPYSLQEGITETVDWLHLYWNGNPSFTVMHD